MFALRKITCFGGWGSEEGMGEKVTHLSITLYSIFSYQFVTVLSSHLHLLSLECLTNKSKQHNGLPSA